MDKFKKQFDIKGYTRHGEDASADTLGAVLSRMEEIKVIVSGYNSDNVFNMDETSLFYRLQPNHTLATKRLSGNKKQKERITMALTSNAIGTVCLPPLIINQYLKP